MKTVLSFFVLVAFIALLLNIWRWNDQRQAIKRWNALEIIAPALNAVFNENMVKDLPEPAQRFFKYTIAPGTPLYTVSEIKMGGQIGLGPKDNPGYMPMAGVQILAPPHGFVWRVKTGKSPISITGTEGLGDEESWVRFWVLGTVPVARGGKNPDHYRAAFGRVIAEAVFWTPAALLPVTGTEWQYVDDNTARAIVRHNGIEQSVDVTVTADGQPTKVVIARWSDANPDNVYQTQPFGGYLYDFKEFDGYKLPTRVEGGNFIGTPDYFPFYKALVENIEFPQAAVR